MDETGWVQLISTVDGELDGFRGFVHADIHVYILDVWTSLPLIEGATFGYFNFSLFLKLPFPAVSVT